MKENGAQVTLLGATVIGVLMRLLARLVPAIYADPKRLRRCANAGCSITAPARFCSDECEQAHYTEMQIW